MMWCREDAAAGDAMDVFRIGSQVGFGPQLLYRAPSINEGADECDSDAQKDNWSTSTLPSLAADGCGQSTTAAGSTNFDGSDSSMYGSQCPRVVRTPIRAKATKQQAPIIAQAKVGAQRTPISAQAKPFIPSGVRSSQILEFGRRLRGHMMPETEHPESSESVSPTRDPARPRGFFPMKEQQFLCNKYEQERIDNRRPEATCGMPCSASSVVQPPTTMQTQVNRHAPNFCPDAQQHSSRCRVWAPDECVGKQDVREQFSRPPPPFKWPYSESIQDPASASSGGQSSRPGPQPCPLAALLRGRAPSSVQVCSLALPSRTPSRTPSPMSPSELSLVTSTMSTMLVASQAATDDGKQHTPPSQPLCSPPVPLRTPSRTPSPYSEGMHSALSLVGRPTQGVIRGRVHASVQASSAPSPAQMSPPVEPEAHVVPPYVIEQPKRQPFGSLFSAVEDEANGVGSAPKDQDVEMPVRHTFIHIPENVPKNTASGSDESKGTEELVIRRCDSAPGVLLEHPNEDKDSVFCRTARHVERTQRVGQDLLSARLDSAFKRPSVQAADLALPKGASPDVSAAVASNSSPLLSMEDVHLRAKCKPCAYYFHKEDGCRMGDACTFCHLCPPEELKKRKKQKAIQWKKNRARSHREALKEAMRVGGSDCGSESGSTKVSVAPSLVVEESR